MNTKKPNLLELSDSEKINLIKEAKTNLVQQVLEERLCREFAQVYSCELSF
jgi:hypothetical protein